MTTQQVIDYVRSHPSAKVKLAAADIDGVLRGKYISLEKFNGVVNGYLGFCDVVFGWDTNDLGYDNIAFTGWHTGYPDLPLRLDLATFRKIPWEGDVPFFLGEFVDTAGSPAPICPRQLLRTVVNQCQQAGFTPLFSQEFEWFNFSETPDTLHQKGFRELNSLTPGMFGYSILRSTLKSAFITDLFELLTQFGIPIEGLHTETGPGVYEAAIAYADALEAADRAILFKTAVKEIAYKHGIVASFMAKWNEQLPGCSGHVHQSLWDGEAKRNLFFDEDNPQNISQLMEHYIAGQLHCLPHLLPMYAPTINSYKRLVEGAWAPTTLTWGFDNRTVALRVIAGSAKGTRLETRVVGADTNPYLALAACLASGLYGIRNALTLQQSATIGNGYCDYANGKLPANLHEATQRMKQSELAIELFGETFVTHFCSTRDWEWQQFSKAVTDWELKRYFEII
ncbi:glutamine synthetase [Parapedobacter pyrenivorans]|uniref:Glutamine synthetase n=1 Tax=Parapedobacter pyrenivorans TaxID=1305674 RepID=A0A917HHD0_9SPHI|nr:glutamine synthetase family protein [Parapedobacter pyrenivorans]GGG78144.1 glutamine synthetase [Parapedobacter pyrenivorans]